MKLCQINKSSVIFLCPRVITYSYNMGICAYLYCRIQAKIIKAKPSYIFVIAISLKYLTNYNTHSFAV